MDQRDKAVPFYSGAVVVQSAWEQGKDLLIQEMVRFEEF